MKPIVLLSLLFSAAASLPAQTPPLLKHSDVVIMYKAGYDIYTNYGVNLLGWGQNLTAEESGAARAAGVKVFGSVGVITECGGFYDRFPKTYEQGLGRDLEGKPAKIPWLSKNMHGDIPFWWCCIRNPEYRQFLRERVTETVKAGAEGVHLDDHMGTAGASAYMDVCFCDTCVRGFRDHLKSLPAEELKRFNVGPLDQFDFRQTMREWVGSETNKYERLSKHPLWPQWIAFQCRGTVALSEELHETASRAAGHSIPMCANACLLVQRHLIDYRSLDLFSSETYHFADKLKFCDTPLFAYREAEAVGRPYAATARGVDWSVVKERNLITLPSGWIALAYAAGQHFMPPNRCWCFTPGKGSDWYHGPVEKFAPLYHFIRRNAACFDGYETFHDLAVVLPYGSFNQDIGRWFELCNQLAGANLSYRLLICGDGILDHPLTAADLAANRDLFFPERNFLLTPDRHLLDQHASEHRVFTTIPETLAGVHPAVQVKSAGPIRALPRVRKGAAVIHLLNYDYDAATDSVRPSAGAKVLLDTKALGVPRASSCTLITMDREPLSLKLHNGEVELPPLGLWSLLTLQEP